MNKKEINWLEIARELQAMAQTGLTFNKEEYDRQRYTRLMEISAEITENLTKLNKQDILDVFSVQPGYATPKIDVRSAIIKDGKILLVKEAQDGKWCMPGGWADVGDFPAAAAEREAWEESGYKVKATKLLGVWDANRAGKPTEFFHAFKVIYLCELIGGEATTSYETTAVDFFDFDNIPELSSERTHPRHLEEIRKHVADKNRASYFE